MQETRGGMAGDLGLDPVVVVSHSDRSVGCRVICWQNGRLGTRATDRCRLAFKAKSCMRYLEAGPRLVGTVPEHLAGYLPPKA